MADGLRALDHLFLAWDPPVPAGTSPTYRAAPDMGSDDYLDREERAVADVSEAHLICSDLSDGRHMVVLDVDHRAQLIPSSTPGHHHLLIGVGTSWWRYRLFLWAAAKAGVIEKGYYRASVARRYTAARLPWVRKDPAGG